MKINTSAVINDYDGTPVTWQKMTGSDIIIVPLTIKDCFIQALNNLAPIDNPLNPTEIQNADTKAKIYALTVRIYQNEEVTLTSDEIVFLKERVGKIWTANVYGRICELFDGSNDVADSGSQAN